MNCFKSENDSILYVKGETEGAETHSAHVVRFSAGSRSERT